MILRIVNEECCVIQSWNETNYGRMVLLINNTSRYYTHIISAKCISHCCFQLRTKIRLNKYFLHIRHINRHIRNNLRIPFGYQLYQVWPAITTPGRLITKFTYRRTTQARRSPIQVLTQLIVEVKQQLGALVPGWVTDWHVLFVHEWTKPDTVDSQRVCANCVGCVG